MSNVRQLHSITSPLPVVVLVDETYVKFSTAFSAHAASYQQRLLSACVEDLMARLQQLPGVQPWICAQDPWRGPYLSPVMRYRGQAQELMEGAQAPASGLMITADVPTIPQGYLETAVAALTGHTCASVQGTGADGTYYLYGWGTGSGTITLPSWYRLCDRDGINRLRRDILCSAPAPALRQLLLQRRPIPDDHTNSGDWHDGPQL